MISYVYTRIMKTLSRMIISSLPVQGVLSSFFCIIFNFSKNYIILLKKEHGFLKESTLELACAIDKTKPLDKSNSCQQENPCPASPALHQDESILHGWPV